MRDVMLIVEDDPLRARALERQAKAHSVVLVVPSGEAAIDVVERAPGRVWLALVDFGLPGIDGAETARRLRALDHEMVVVVATAQPDVNGISRAAFAAGAMFVPKPVTKDEMHVLVARARAETSTGRIDAAADAIADEAHLDDDVEFVLRRSAHGEDRKMIMAKYGIRERRMKKLASRVVQALEVGDLDAAGSMVRLRATAPSITAGTVHAPPATPEGATSRVDAAALMPRAGARRRNGAATS